MINDTEKSELKSDTLTKKETSDNSGIVHRIVLVLASTVGPYKTPPIQSGPCNKALREPVRLD